MACSASLKRPNAEGPLDGGGMKKAALVGG
jgi:hypothetical protein